MTTMMTTILKAKRMRAAALAAAILLAAALWPAIGQADGHGEAAEDVSIWITGTASREVEPDTTRINFEVSVLEERAAQALSRGMEVLAAVRGRVAELDDDAQISTRTVYLFQETRWIDGERVPVGFRYRNSLTLTADGTDAAGALLGALVQGGGDEVRLSGISFTASQQALVERQLLAEAVEDARRTAGVIARVFGLGTPMAVEVRIGSLTAREVEDEEEAEFAAEDAMGAMTADTRATSATVIAGASTVLATVQVRFVMQSDE